MREEDFDKKWEKIYFEHIDKNLHTQTAPETLKRLGEQDKQIAVLSTNHCNIMEKLDEIVDRFNNFENKLDKALEKKADVWVEKAVSWAGYTVVGSVILALLALVITK